MQQVQKKSLAKVGVRYYEGDHDIKNYRVFYVDGNGELKEDKHKSNIKISHPFFTENVDQTVQYVLSNKDGFVKSDDPALQAELDFFADALSPHKIQKPKGDKMTLKEMLAPSGAVLLVLLTLVQVAPIKLNPWSALAKGIGRAFNADVLKSLEEVKAQQKASQQRLADHIKVDNQRDADRHRERILRFNNELLRDIPHTREDFIEILTVIDDYERYCKANEDYKNNRAVHAIANIGRVYDERLQKHDFLRE